MYVGLSRLTIRPGIPLATMNRGTAQSVTTSVREADLMRALSMIRLRRMRVGDVDRRVRRVVAYNHNHPIRSPFRNKLEDVSPSKSPEVCGCKQPPYFLPIPRTRLLVFAATRIRVQYARWLRLFS